MALLSQADHSFTQGNYQQANFFAERLTVIDPQNESGWYYLGISYERLGQDTYAVRPLKKTLELSSPGDKYYFAANGELGCIYTRKNQATTAIPYLREGVKGTSGNEFLYFNALGKACFDSAKWQLAIAACMAAEALKPEDPVVQKNLTQVEKQIGNPRLEDLISPLGLLMPTTAVVSFEHWQLNTLIAAKNRDLPTLLREGSASELQDLSTKLEQAILDYTDKSAAIKDHAEQNMQNVRQAGDNGNQTIQISDTHVYTTQELDQLLGGLTHPTTQEQVDQEREVSRLYEEKVEILKSILAAVKVELANRSK